MGITKKKTYNRYTKYKKKEVRAYTTKNNQITKKNSNRRTKEQRKCKRVRKKQNGNSVFLPFNNYLNVNCLNYPIKWHAMTEWIKINKTQLYAPYKKLTSALKTHVGWKWKNEKNISCKW